MNSEKTHSKIKDFILYIWTIILLSQVLKGSFAFIYFSIFFSALFIIAIFIYKKGFIYKGIDIFTVQIWIFYVLIVYVSSITFLYGSSNDFIKAFPRMIIMPLTLIIFMNLISSRHHFQKIIDLFIFFSIIAAISLIYQVYNGPLYFLVESSTREGLNRYASTFGSLTIYGGAVGIITLLVLRKNINFILKFLIITLFLTSAFITLAKAAVMNILIVVIFSLFFLKIKFKSSLLSLIIFGIVSIYFLFPEIGIYIIKSFAGLGLSSSGEIDTTSTSSFVYQFLKRFFYSVEYLSNFDILNLFFGFGLIGGQGVFGLPYSFTGTTHNQFMDLYLIGGVFLFLNVLIVIICLMLELYKMKSKDHIAETFFFCNIVAIINMFFFNGYIYQPVTSIVFWLSIVYVLNFRDRIYEKSL